MSSRGRERTLEEKYRAWPPGLYSLSPHPGQIRQYRRLAKQGVATVPDLLAKYDALHRRTQRVALEAAGFTGDRRLVPLLARVFRDDAGLRKHAAMSLGYLGGKRAVTFALSVLSRELASERMDPALYEPAFWALSSTMYAEDAAVLSSFLDVFEREDASPQVRSTVLDKLGAALDPSEVDRRSSLFRRARRLALAALDDPGDEVRFFAIYAVGQMGLTEALPRLKRMARSDTGSCLGLWTIAEEAQDVISHLTTGWWPDREPRTGRILDAPPAADATE